MNAGIRKRGENNRMGSSVSRRYGKEDNKGLGRQDTTLLATTISSTTQRGLSITTENPPAPENLLKSSAWSRFQVLLL